MRNIDLSSETPQYWLGYIVGQLDSLLENKQSETDKLKELRAIVQQYKKAMSVEPKKWYQF